MHGEEKNIPVSAEYEETNSRDSSEEQGNRIRGNTAPHQNRFPNARKETNLQPHDLRRGLS